MTVDTFAHIPATAAISDLSAEDATRRLPDAPHTIAEIVTHLLFWQAWFLARCQGEAHPMAASAAVGWPDVSSESWPALRQRFLTGRAALQALANEPNRAIEPPIECPPLADHTIYDALVHVTIHSAYHVGQIVTLRQLMGLWPPATGTCTW